MLFKSQASVRIPRPVITGLKLKDIVDFISSDGPPLVSIIIPCWNAERYVSEAIESALAQTYPNVEVIVIDDGSTDGSLEVIKLFGDRIRWETGPNRGGCAARNSGVRLSSGEFIQFLDADDFLCREKVSMQVEALRRYSVDIVTCDRYELPCSLVPDESKLIQFSLYEDPVNFFLRNATIQTSSPIHRRFLLQQINGFDEALPCAQEYDLHLRLACIIKEIHHIRMPLFTIRKRDNSVSSNYKKVLYQYQKILNRIVTKLATTGGLTDPRRKAFAETMFQAGHSLLRMGEPILSREYFLWAYKIHHRHGYTSSPKWRQWIYKMLHGYYGTIVADKIAYSLKNIS